jgi:hypothetical protein
MQTDATSSSSSSAASGSLSSSLAASAVGAVPIFHAGTSAHVHRMPVSDSADATHARGGGGGGAGRAQCGGAYIVRPTAEAVANGA